MIPLIHWSWRSYLRLALIPLLVVELGLLCAYLLTNAVMRDSNISALRDLADSELRGLTQLEARAIGRQLKAVTQAVELLRQESRNALARPHEVDERERRRYRHSAGGAWYTAEGEDRPAGFYSAITAIGPAQRQKAWRLTRIDPLLRHLVDASPLTVQAYVNTFDSYNRIYPFFNPIEQYDERMDIPRYNFYYLADASNNPTREVVWTEAYVDPAGQGWMASAVAPVYRGDFLEAVVGIDVRVADFIEKILDTSVPWDGYMLLLDKTGTILAMPPAAERDLGLDEMTEHHYQRAILNDTVKPESFNVFARDDTRSLAQALRDAPAGVGSLSLAGRKLAAWSRIEDTGWTLVAVAPEAAVYQHANVLNQRFLTIGVLMAVAMVVFYIGYFLFLFRRARDSSRAIAEPLERIRAGFHAIGEGNFHPPLPSSEIKELDGCSRDLRLLGEQLEHSTRAMERARREAESARSAQNQLLGRLSHELRTPLNAILGFGQLLELEALTADQHRQVAQILGSGSHLLGLVNALLQATHADTEAEPRSIPVAPLVSDILRWAQPLAREHRVLLNDECRDSRLSVRADPARLRQALFNLVSNAIKYNRSGGSVSVSVQRRGEDRVRLVVTDTGPGLSVEQQGRLFQLFERLEAPQRDISGNGVGLVVVRHLVEAMGGSVGLVSNPGAGSQFWIELAEADMGAES